MEMEQEMSELSTFFAGLIHRAEEAIVALQFCEYRFINV